MAYTAVLPATIIVKGKTTATWVANNPVLKKYELGAELTSTPGQVLLKVGDGVTAWNSLQYCGGSSGGGGAGSVATDNIWLQAGDLAVGSGNHSAVRLPRGGALTYLRVNSAGTNLEYAALSISSADILNGTIVDGDISATANIVRSKLNFGTGLVNNDLSPTAGIVRTKLDFGTGLVNNDIAAGAGILRSKLDFGTGLVDGDIASAANIQLSKLAATGTRDSAHALFGDGTWKVPTADTTTQTIFSYRGNGRKWAAALAQALSIGVGPLSWKTDVKVATTANGTLTTAFANGQVVDGVTLVTGDRILLKNQTNQYENGIRVVAASGTPARATDADSAAELLRAGVKVTSGTTNKNTFWYQNTQQPITVGDTVGSSNLVWNKFKPAKMGWYGDSVTELMYGLAVDRFRNRMARYNNNRVSAGWVNAAPDSTLATGGVNQLHPTKFRLTFGSYNSPTGKNIVEERGLGLYTFYGQTGSVLTLSDQNNADYSPTFAVAEFHYTAAGTASDAGSLEIRVDGNLVQTISTYDATLGTGNFESGRTYTWVGTEAAHAVTVTFITNPSRFDGVYLAYSDEFVWIYNGGNAGEKYNDYLFTLTGHTNPPPIEVGRNIDFDAVLLAYGINDWTDGVAAMGTDITAAINTTRTLIDDVSLGILFPYATLSRTDWESFVTAAKSAAAALNTPVCDTSWMIKPNLGAGSVGGDPHDLITDVDNTHQNTQGGILWADEVANFMVGDRINWITQTESIAQRILGRVSGVSGGLLDGQYTAQFFTPAFDAALYIKSATSGSSLAQMLLQHNVGAASTGTMAQIGWSGHDGTSVINANGIPTAIGWMRILANGTLSATNRGTDIAFGNAANGSTTVAERMRILAGGWLQLSEFAAPAGTASKVALGARLSNSNHQAGFLMPDSSVRVVASSSFTDPDVDPTAGLRPTGALAETFPRAEIGTAALAGVLTSGQLYMVAIGLKAGMTVTNIVFYSGTTAVVSPTHWWFSLHDASRVLLGQTADQTTSTTGWSTTTATAVPLALSSAYAVTSSGLYYLAMAMTAGTMPTLIGAAGNSTPWATVPILNGQSSTGLTTTAPGTAAAITAGGARAYAYVS